MKHLADLVFDYVWMLEATSDDQLDPDFAIKKGEEVWSVLTGELSSEERFAFIAAAQRARAVLLAEPDEYGYTPRRHVSEKQKQFLEALCAGKFQ